MLILDMINMRLLEEMGDISKKDLSSIILKLLDIVVYLTDMMLEHFCIKQRQTLIMNSII